MKKNQILSKNFFARDTLKVAKELLGCVLVKKDKNKTYKGIIVETEAYKANDPACHAYKGKTKRAQTLFKDPGLSYVYMIYGMYYCINVVTEPFDTAGAVLIRALEPLEEIQNTAGPGKLCRALNIDKSHNEINLCDESSEIFILKGEKILEENVVQTTRIGIKLAADYPWRFYVKGNPHVSKK